MHASALLLIAGTALFLLALGLVEARLHQRRLERFRIRVHVNGTRGKSSVTRLIAAGMRAGGLRTCAKTTGTLPRLIHPDGVEEPIYRVGKPNVIEQVGVIQNATRLGAEAIVVECMALQPFLQWISTARLIQPTHGVITNIRADHLDVMGPGVRDVALALAGSVPLGARLYVGDTRYREIFEEACRERKSELFVVRPETAALPVTLEELAEFSYIEHAENVDLALRICEDLGIERGVALRGMQAASPDPGALTVERARIEGARLTFINGFAANDPESTGQVWELASAWAASGVKKIALFNCRADRADRSQQLGQAYVSWTPPDHCVVVGTGTSFFLSAAERAGMERSRILVLEGESASRVATKLTELAGSEGVVVGLGNISGVGLELLELLQKARESAPDAAEEMRRFSRGPRREMWRASRAALPSELTVSAALPIAPFEAPVFERTETESTRARAVARRPRDSSGDSRESEKK